MAIEQACFATRVPLVHSKKLTEFLFPSLVSIFFLDLESPTAMQLHSTSSDTALSPCLSHRLTTVNTLSSMSHCLPTLCCAINFHNTTLPIRRKQHLHATSLTSLQLIQTHL